MQQRVNHVDSVTVDKPRAPPRATESVAKAESLRRAGQPTLAGAALSAEIGLHVPFTRG